jgi:hypothetical protein
VSSSPSDLNGPPPAGGGSKPETVNITGTLLGVVFGLLLLIALGIAIWFIARRKREEVQDAPEDAYETEIESHGELTFEADEQYDSCDGGTNFDQDENEFLDQGFEAALFRNGAEEGQMQF